MIEKHIEGLNLTVKQAEPVSIKQPAGRISTLVIALCALAFVLCTLLSVAPLSRILDPVIQLQTPFGTQLARVGAWLPTDIGLTPYRRASLADTGYRVPGADCIGFRNLWTMRIIHPTTSTCAQSAGATPDLAGNHRGGIDICLHTGNALARYFCLCQLRPRTGRIP